MRYYFIYNTVSGLRSYRLDQPTITIGSLPSNHLVLAGKTVEPIHAVVEKQTDGSWRITDLGSESGISVNGQKINVETDLHAQDKIILGDVELHFEHQLAGQEEASQHVAQGAILESASPRKRSTSTKKPFVAKKLFHVDEPKQGSRGKTLEVVAYWGDRVLEIEHYHRSGSRRSYPSIATVGQPPHADFLAAGPKKLQKFTIAKATASGFTLKLADGMKAKLRRAGKIKSATKAGNYKLSTKDIADVEYGPIRYFFLYVTLPKLKLPKQSPRDPLFLSLIWTGFISFGIMILLLSTIDLPNDPNKMDDVWSVVTVSQEEHKPIKKEQEKPKPKKKVVKVPKPKVKQKPIVPKAKPKLVKQPEKIVKKAKPKQVVIPPKKSILTTPKPPTPAAKPKASPNPKPVPTPASSAKKTSSPADGKAAGPKVAGKPKGAALGARGAGMPGAKGSQRKGKGKSSAPGVEGVKNNKSSGVNLSKLGMNAGKIFNKSGAGAIATNFKSSSGGLGGGSGTAGARSRGLGGSLTSGSTLGLEGSSSQLNKFGSGGGGLLSGSGGTGGFSTSGPGGRGRAPVNINVSSAGAPGVSGGLSEGEVTQVLKAHENAIRHCYEQLLQRNPKANGHITAKFVIGAQGRVISVSKSTDTVGSPTLVDCIFSKIRQMSFPKPRGGEKVQVSRPWKFHT